MWKRRTPTVYLSKTSPKAQETPCNFYNDRDYEYNSSDDISVVGRLKQNSHFWKTTLHASPFVQNIIEEGYVVPFLEIPTAFYAENNRSSLKHQTVVESAIEDLLFKGAFTIFKQTYCCNPLTVAEGSQLRLVLDLRHVNKFVMHHKFKYEDLRTLSERLFHNF